MAEQLDTPASDTRCGFVALIGAPNVGKSTLINALVGTKVAIVSHKVQTTRALLRGIATEGDAQLILVDTPGIFAPKRRLERAMVTNAWAGAHDADIVCMLVDAKRGLDEETEAVLAPLADAAQPKALVINKVDLVDKPALLTLAQAAQRAGEVRRDLHDLARSPAMASSTSSAGSPPTSRPGRGTIPRTRSPTRRCASSRPRSRARSSFSACTRNCRISRRSRPSSGRSCRDGAVRIEQTIYVERESQRKIVLGKGGATIKAIGAEARRDIAEMVEAPVHLFLFVKVREHWADDPERYRDLGLEFPKD